MLTRTPRIPGTDGRKMSKSYGNFISLSESNDSIRTKTRAMMTDPARKRRRIRGIRTSVRFSTGTSCFPRSRRRRSGRASIASA